MWAHIWYLSIIYIYNLIYRIVQGGKKSMPTQSEVPEF